jgi:hypothetical protein
VLLRFVSPGASSKKSHVGGRVRHCGRRIDLRTALSPERALRFRGLIYQTTRPQGQQGEGQASSPQHKRSSHSRDNQLLIAVTQRLTMVRIASTACHGMHSARHDCNVDTPREHRKLDAHTSLAVLPRCAVRSVLCYALCPPVSALGRLSAAVVRDWQAAMIQRL